MAISLKHLFQSAKTDGPDNTIVQPSDWNDEHVLTQATGKLLGRTTAGTGATEEIAPGTGITLSAGTLSADVTSVAGRTGAVTLSTADISGLTTGYVQKTSATGSAYLPVGTTGQREGSPAAGYIRYNTTTGKFEGYGSAWGNIGGGAAIGDTPPANPGAGDLWWNSADGRMYVYYTDANSSQWVDLSAGGAGQYLPLTGGTVTGNATFTGGTASFLGSSGTDAIRIAGAGGSWFWIDNPTTTTMRFSSGATAGTNPMVLDSSGNVGIGTSSPGRKMEVVTSSSSSTSNTVRVKGYQAAFEVMNNASDQNWYFGVNDASGSRLQIGKGANAAQGAAPIITCDTSDRFLVGVTSSRSGGHAIWKNGATNEFALEVINTKTNNATATHGLLLRYDSISPQDNNLAFRFEDSAGVRCDIRNNGNVLNVNNVYGSLSDARLKENIVDTTPKLDDLMAVKIRNYNLIANPDFKQIGVIAQEIEQVFPGIVDESPEGYKSVKYSVLVPIIVKALQELKAELDTVKAELAQLKGGE